MELCINIIYILGLFQSKNEEGKDIHNEIFKNIPNFIKNRLRVKCLQDILVVYNYKVLIHKLNVIPPIPDSIIPVGFCRNN